jgi:hypothetical protein
VSSLWTPSGEHQPSEDPNRGADAPQNTGIPDMQGPAMQGDEREPTQEEIDALREVHARLTQTPVEDVIANHALGIWQLALVHLGVITPPDVDGTPARANLPAAGLAIDAMAAIVDGLGNRLGVHEPVLRDALTQAQMLFVDLSSDPPA